jgi:hypothetical protein
VEDDEGQSPLASIAMSDEPRWKATLIAIEHLARLAALVLFAFSLILCFGVLLYGAPQVFQNAPGSDMGATLFILAPIPIGFLVLVGYPLLAYYSFLLAALYASGAFLIFAERRRLVSGFARTVSRLRAPDRHDASSGLVQLPQIFLAIFFFDYIYAIIVILSGTSPRIPPFGELPLWYQFFTFANASVWEEIAARTILCGIPLMLAYMLAHGARPQYPEAPPEPAGQPGPSPYPAPALSGDGRTFSPAPPSRPPLPLTLSQYLRSRTSRGLWGYFIGGGFRMGPLEVFFIVGSSIMFGIAHVPGWDIWKLLPTFIAGLGFAYLFLKIGIHAAIILHFTFDYLDLTAGLVPGFDALFLFLVLLWFAVGAFFFAHYIVQALKWVTGMAKKSLLARKPA